MNKCTCPLLNYKTMWGEGHHSTSSQPIIWLCCMLLYIMLFFSMSTNVKKSQAKWDHIIVMCYRQNSILGINHNFLIHPLLRKKVNSNRGWLLLFFTAACSGIFLHTSCTKNYTVFLLLPLLSLLYFCHWRELVQFSPASTVAANLNFQKKNKFKIHKPSPY